MYFGCIQCIIKHCKLYLQLCAVVVGVGFDESPTDNLDNQNRQKPDTIKINCYIYMYPVGHAIFRISYVFCQSTEKRLRRDHFQQILQNSQHFSHRSSKSIILLNL